MVGYLNKVGRCMVILSLARDYRACCVHRLVEIKEVLRFQANAGIRLVVRDDAVFRWLHLFDQSSRIAGTMGNKIQVQGSLGPLLSNSLFVDEVGDAIVAVSALVLVDMVDERRPLLECVSTADTFTFQLSGMELVLLAVDSEQGMLIGCLPVSGADRGLLHYGSRHRRRSSRYGTRC